jgi:hypothetical protein
MFNQLNACKYLEFKKSINIFNQSRGLAPGASKLQNFSSSPGASGRQSPELFVHTPIEAMGEQLAESRAS